MHIIIIYYCFILFIFMIHFPLFITDKIRFWEYFLKNKLIAAMKSKLFSPVNSNLFPFELEYA